MVAATTSPTGAATGDDELIGVGGASSQPKSDIAAMKTQTILIPPKLLPKAITTNLHAHSSAAVRIDTYRGGPYVS